MENQNIKTAAKIGGYSTLIGSLCMIAGAALFGISGADLDKALYAGELASYLQTVNANVSLVKANLALWIGGVILIGAGATMMTSLSTQRPIVAKLAQYNYWIAIPLVVASYVAWMAIVVQLSPGNWGSSAALAEVVGWFASRADWIATILVLGIGPVLISIAGRNEWVPGWLYIWSFIALIAGLLNGIAIFAGGLVTYGFLIIPIGLSWMLAASVVLFKRMR